MGLQSACGAHGRPGACLLYGRLQGVVLHNTGAEVVDSFLRCRPARNQTRRPSSSVVNLKP